MKYCENGHSNRDDAKFCGTCGQPIVQKSADFTLDKYPDIKFDVTDYSKSKKLGEISDILTVLFAVPLLLVFLIAVISFGFDFDVPIAVTICCLVLGIVPSVVMSILMLKRFFRLKANSDFIEITDQLYARIAKNKKLGLLEKCDGYIVRLPARYDLIEKINNECYSIRKNGKQGIYSTTMNIIIVPVKYENVTLKYDGVWSAVNKGIVTYYNHKGKVVK